MKRFAVIGPPTTVFLHEDGAEIQEAHTAANIRAGSFLRKLRVASQ